MEIEKDRILYEKENYIAFEGGNSDIIIYNTKKPFKRGHTHLKSKKMIPKVIESAIKKKFPLHWSNYFIESLIRLSTDKIFIKKLKKLRDTRKSKDKKYYNRPSCIR